MTWHSQHVLHVQIEKRIRYPDTARQLGSDAEGIQSMADTLKVELDGCIDIFPAKDWPLSVVEYMAVDTVESEDMDAVNSV